MSRRGRHLTQREQQRLAQLEREARDLHYPSLAILVLAALAVVLALTHHVLSGH